MQYRMNVFLCGILRQTNARSFANKTQAHFIKEESITKRNARNIIIFAILTICLAGYTVYSRLMQGMSFSVGDVLNLSFLGVMAAIVIAVSLSHFRKADILIHDLRNACSALKKGYDWNTLQFNNPELHEAFANYCAEMERLDMGTAQKSISCDIADYMTMSVVYRSIRKGSCDAISGVMTGIGILGTFIGLTLGLRNFSTEYDAMQNSIMELLSGIKTAFLTSIYGVLYSIVFSWLYRRLYQDAVNALEDFHSVFYQKAIPNAQNEIYSRLIHAQEEQTENMRKFAGQVSEVMIDQFGQSIKALNRGIDEFMLKAVTVQEDKLRVLVQEYLTAMNQDVFGGQLQELRQTLAAINDGEKENAERLAVVIQDVCKRDDAIIDANSRIAAFSGSLQNYLDSMQNYQDKINDLEQVISDRYQALTSSVEAHTAASTQSLEMTTAMQRGLQTFTEQVSGSFEQITNAVAALSAGSEQAIISLRTSSETCMHNLEKSANAGINTVRLAVNENKQAVTQLANAANGIAREFNQRSRQTEEELWNLTAETRSFMEQLSAASKENANLVREWQEAAQQETSCAMERASASIRDSAEQMHTNYETLTNEMEQGIHSTFHSFDETLSGIVEEFAQVIAQLEEQSRGIPRALMDTHNLEQEERKHQIVQMQRLNAQIEKLVEHLMPLYELSGQLQQSNAQIEKLGSDLKLLEQFTEQLQKLNANIEELPVYVHPEEAENHEKS